MYRTIALVLLRVAAGCVGRSLGVDDPSGPRGTGGDGGNRGRGGNGDRDGGGIGDGGGSSTGDGSSNSSGDGGNFDGGASGGTVTPVGVARCTRGAMPVRLPRAFYDIGATSGADGRIYLLDLGHHGSGTIAYAYDLSSARLGPPRRRAR